MAVLVATAEQRSLGNVVLDGLRRHAWTDQQLKTLGSRIREIDWEKSHRDSLKVQLLYHHDFLKLFDQHGRFEVERRHFSSFRPSHPMPGGIWERIKQEPLAILTPSGVDKMMAAAVWETNLEQLRDVDEHVGEIDMKTLRGFPEVEDRKQWSVPSVLLIISSLEKQLRQIVLARTVQRLMLSGIALERFYLEHGKYPAELGELVPNYLDEVPRDLFSDHRLSYELGELGLPRLWSVGPTYEEKWGEAPKSYYREEDKDTSIRFDWASGAEW